MGEVKERGNDLIHCVSTLKEITAADIARVNTVSNTQLKVHCRSADDDLHEQIISYNHRSYWSFHVNFWYTTLFWCELEWVDPATKHVMRAKYDAFDASRVDDINRCDFCVCFSFLNRKHVYIQNDLSPDLPLRFYCQSKNEEIGEGTLAYKESFNWSFHSNIFHTPLFWCSMQWVDDELEHVMRKSFDVYDGSKEKCGCDKCVWYARQDGIYHRKSLFGENIEFVYGWETGKCNNVRYCHTPKLVRIQYTVVAKSQEK
ncbi:hypothetical protein AQUCO_00200214v1 [Aquilegia coerulea]|uniref:S-protein homolog n=1 Tax=Aquilegia coerulea TaxID=218851 RepID=A0A2G5F255_AQUCA|nr:hypothetical protein AQUCO_00200214v1 [Aquilegia coerulea]